MNEKRQKKRDKFVRIDSDTVQVEVSTKGCFADPFGLKQTERVTVQVQHAEGYGVLVSGTYDPVVGRRALRRVGYTGANSFGYRPWASGAERSPGGDIVFFFGTGL